MSLQTNLTRQLVGEEGRSQYAYQDSEGWWTIGVGRLCDKRKPGSGLTLDEQDFLFTNDCERVLRAIDEYMPWVNELDEARKGAVMNMVFQMGVGGVLKFSNSMALLRQKRFAEAADNMLLSVWARQQTPGRAARVTKQIKTGQWQFKDGT